MSEARGEVIPAAARPKAWVFGRLPAGIVASNPAGGQEFLSLVSVVCLSVTVKPRHRGVPARQRLSHQPKQL
jgi:hypothetical protein